MNRYNAIIVGRGLAAVSAAARLTELGITDILMLGQGSGGTPSIAAINFVLPDNPYGDTPAQYAQDMLDAGYQIGDHALVEEMAERSQDGYELLLRWGVQFAHEPGGTPKLRHLSGHTYPRSLCSTTGLIGAQMLAGMTQKLMEKGVVISDARCLKVLSDGNRAYGVTVIRPERFNQLENIYAPVIIAAWGGVGNLIGRSTYPGDIRGDTLAMAHRAGADMVDLEFIEYEPMVVLEPEGAAGEPCPTAMLGEGAYLKNSKGERFLLKERPQGEKGASKTLINRMIWKETAAGNGSPNGGVWVDLRHLPDRILKGYPWFYNRMKANGVDPNQNLIEVGPMMHSFSGGIRVNSEYRSNIMGFYAVGEASGGIHGACRCAGNAASQAVLSGMLCAEAVFRSGDAGEQYDVRFSCERRIEKGIYYHFAPMIRKIAADAIGVYRSEETLCRALEELEILMRNPAVKQDDETMDTILAVRLIAEAALARKESRGTHLRIDYPESSEEFCKKIMIRGKIEKGM